jgi:antitoxin component YwqK of YwqJK toxin-antitoxin module
MEYREDRNHDGNWDYWVYYENGHRVRADYDNNFDGKADEWWTFSDDGIDTLKKDTDFNGIPDEICTYKYGIIQYEEMKPNGSKFATEREFYKNGALTEIWRGGDSNGNFKEQVQYDPFFNPISTNTPASQ